MVPGSTLRYGSNFIRLTFKPRLSSRQPMEAAAKPLPKDDTTPPVTKMYFADIASSPQIVIGILCRVGARSIMAERPVERNLKVRHLETASVMMADGGKDKLVSCEPAVPKWAIVSCHSVLRCSES